MPTCAYRMMRRGNVLSLSTNGQIAVQVPQLKHAETSAAPNRFRSDRSSVSMSLVVVVVVVVTRSPPGGRLRSGSSPHRSGPRPRRRGHSDAFPVSYTHLRAHET